MNAFVFCKKYRYVLGFSREVLYTIIQMFDTEKHYTVDVYGRTTDPFMFALFPISLAGFQNKAL